MTSFFACVLRARSNAPEAPVMRRAASVAMMSITTIISIRVKAEALLAQLSVIGSRLSGGPTARLRGIMSKIVKGVVETRSFKLGALGARHGESVHRRTGGRRGGADLKSELVVV